MTDLAWTATRTDTIDQFQGQTPRPEDEATIIDVFEQHPQLVLRAIDETAQALAAGKVTWAWSVLATRLVRGTTAIREATADTSNEKTRRIANAERWIHNAGLHYDQERHVEADLFGDEFSTGILTDYANDAALRARMLELWRKHRPRGLQAEADSEAWHAHCREVRQRLDQMRRDKAAELAAKQEAHHQPDPEPEPVTIGAPDDDIDFG